MMNLIKYIKSRILLKKRRKVMKDIKRGKAVLEMIDNHLIATLQTRRQRKNFWNEFFRSQNVRLHVYKIIEDALGKETNGK